MTETMLDKGVIKNNLTCPICMLLFTKPSMLDCGHSFCSGCIVSWLEKHDNCPVCRSPAEKTIINISLQNVVEEHRKKYETMVFNEKLPSHDSSPVCDETTDESENDGETSSTKSRRCRFSDKDDVVYLNDSNTSCMDTLRRLSPPPLSARPLRSSLVQPIMHELDRSMPLNRLDSDSDSVMSEEHKPFIRKAMQRRSATFTRTIDDDDISAKATFSRTSMFRRSIGVIRRSRSKRRANETAPATIDESDVREKSKSLWKRLLSFRKKNVFPSMGGTKKEANGLAPPYGQVCLYDGTGSLFQKIEAGEEITVVVFGKSGVGKTTFLDNVALSVEKYFRKHARMVGLTERTMWSGLQISTRSLAHMMTMALTTPTKTYVIDIIDAVSYVEGSSHTWDSFIRASDAAVLLYSCTDSPSLLNVMTTHRHISKLLRKPCVLLGNNFSEGERIVESMGPNLARDMDVKHWETNLAEPGPASIEILLYLARCVLEKRCEDVSFFDTLRVEAA
ncbi:unnamed protein product [Auanema sp. JU1783]|nr:unnamed protein product [Auanema sp. JU1783]